MKQSLNLKQSQHLTLTPQLQQSLLLLQLSSTELELEIHQALETNPLLEQVENMTPQSGSSEESTNHTPDDTLEINWQETFETRRLGLAPSTTNADFDRQTEDVPCLTEHLIWQIKMTTLSNRDQKIAQALIHSLDDQGYQTLSLTEICSIFDSDLQVEEDEVHAVASLIKTLDPVGIGTKNLQERLTLLLHQFEKHTTGFTIAEKIISQHLDLLAKHDLVKIKRVLQCDDDALTAGVQLITQLDPRITNAWYNENNNYIAADVITKQIDDKWRVELNPDNAYKLRTNKTYTAMLESPLDKSQKDYIQSNLQQAKSFIKSVNSRYDTLLRVAQAIVDRQQAFIEHGEQHLRPMVLQDIAEELEMHESTISRATAGKYLLTPRGVFELKFFFPNVVNSSATGDSTSSIAIKSLIKKIISDEPRHKPLSDSKIALALEDYGHTVARRTVAKYRESMHIAPSSNRKALI